MDKPGTLGKLGDLGGKVGSAIGDEVKNIVKTAKFQVTAVEDAGVEKPGGQQVPGENTKIPKEQNQEFVKEMYGIEKDKEVPSKEQAEAQSKKSKTEDAQKLQEIRALTQKLHKDTYYDPLDEKSKPQEDKERPQERVERQEEEEKKEDWFKKQEEKKKAPVSVQRAQRTTEMGKTSG